MLSKNALARKIEMPLANEVANQVKAGRLDSSETAEVINFLAVRPLHTVTLAGFVRDNGLVSPANRGEFYGVRNEDGELEGVALIGHATLIEARTDRALSAFAEIARRSSSIHMIMGEKERIAEFWEEFEDCGRRIRRVCREMLFQLRWPVEVREPVLGLRKATRDDLDLILPVHAEMAFEESGVNPLDQDPVGFRKRCERRINQSRTWVWVEDGKLIFKADVVSETPQAIYLEGVWTAPDHRGYGYAMRCLSQMSRTLLLRADSICLLVNEQNREAHNLYRRAGYKLTATYDTLFL